MLRGISSTVLHNLNLLHVAAGSRVQEPLLFLVSSSILLDPAMLELKKKRGEVTLPFHPA